MKVSKFIKLDKNILLEYIYNEDNNIGSGYSILINNRNNANENSFISGSASSTNNTTGNQLFKLDPISNTYGLINKSNYSFLVQKDYSEGFPVRYDVIRVHLPTNYTFGEYIGFYLKIYSFDYNNKKSYSLSNYFFDISDVGKNTLINFSNPPLFFQEKLWGKYVEIQIPALSAISNQRNTARTVAKENTINYNLTNGIGMSINAPIFMDFHFIHSKKTVNTVTTYLLTSRSTTTIPQTPDFEKLGLRIEHSTKGDYIEIFGIYNNNIAEFNNFLNNSIYNGKKYYVEYEITLFEQNIRGKSIKIVMTENFNEKVEYRPIIKYSTTTAVVDVIMNVIDDVDSSIIQRRASYGMLQDEVAKYSLNLTKINLSRASKPKIYNIKNPEGAAIFGNLNGSAYSDGRLYGNAGGSLFVTNNSRNLFGLSRGKSGNRNIGVGSVFNNTGFGTEGGQISVGSPGTVGKSGLSHIADSSITKVYLDPFAVNFSVFADKYNILAKTESVKYGKTSFYGIGRLKILIQPFDQIIQFTLARDVSNATNVNLTTQGVASPEFMDLTNMGEIKLVFKNDKTSVDFKLYTQTQQFDLTLGQVVFRISENKINDIRKIYASGINVFYITTTLNTITTVAYSGLFTMFDNLDNVQDMNNDQKQIESDDTLKEPTIVTSEWDINSNVAIVTKRIVSAGTASAPTVTQGTNNVPNVAPPTNSNSSPGNQVNTSVPSGTRILGIEYQISAKSDLVIDGYVWTPEKLKTVLGLAESPTKLTIKTDSIYSNDKFLDRLDSLKSKLEKTLATKEDRDAYIKKQNETRSQNGTSNQYSYYQTDVSTQTDFATLNNTQLTKSIALGDYRVYDKEAGVLLNASIPKANAETLRGNDLIELLGKKWVVDAINKTTSVVTVKIDKPVPVQTGSSNPTNTD